MFSLQCFNLNVREVPAQIMPVRVTGFSERKALTDGLRPWFQGFWLGANGLRLLVNG
jgi:hypothetical protein